MTDAVQRRSDLSRAVWILHALHFAIWVSLPLAATLIGVRMISNGYVLEPRVVLVVLALSLVQTAMVVIGCAAVHLLAHAVLSRFALPQRWCSFLSMCAGLGLPAAWAALQVNRHYLPDLLEWPSVAGNLGMLTVFFLVVALSSAGVERWRSGVARAGQSPSWWSLAILVLVVLLPMGAAVGVRRAAGPDVVVLLIDALRADHLGTYGYDRDTSPRIDEFAQDAVLFEQAISASGFTKTSIASLFTGLDPHSHGVFRGNRSDTPTRITSDVLAPEFETLADAMSAHGLFSAAWVMNPQLQNFMGFDQGFAPYRQDVGSFYFIRDGFLRWYQRIGRFGQYFAYLHALDLHDPYHPPERFDGLFGQHAELFADVDLSAPGAWSRLIREIRDGEREVSGLEVDQLRADYDSVIRSVDDQVGRFLDELRDRGIYDDAIIVMTSDHGDGFMEHGFISHSTTPYDELVRVPLIIKLPGSKHAGRRVRDQVRAVDLAPTLLELVGVPELEGIDGRSLVPLIEEAPDADHPPYAFVEETGATGIRTENWKALYFLFEGNWEIYDLRADPTEQNDLSDDSPEDVEELRMMVLQAVEERSRREVGTVPLDAETVEALRSLGYIE